MGGVFAAYATDGLTHEFGHSRGAVDLYQESVPAANNPVSGASFSAPTSIMTYPYGVTTWDRYTIGIINHSKTTIYQGRPSWTLRSPRCGCWLRTPPAWL
jgi:hypothetical protein